MNRSQSISCIFLLLFVPLFTSCNNSVRKAFEELQNMPATDYSYIIQPEYKSSKELTESKIKELFSADEVRVGASGFHSYDKTTKKQINERYWLKVVLLNSKAVEDFKDEVKMNNLGKEVARSFLNDINNQDKYTLIEITFVVQWNDGTQKQLKQNIFYSLPTLEVTNL